VVNGLRVLEESLWKRKGEDPAQRDRKLGRHLGRRGYEGLAGEEGHTLCRPHVRHNLPGGAGRMDQQADAIETVNGPAQSEEIDLSRCQRGRLLISRREVLSDRV